MFRNGVFSVLAGAGCLGLLGTAGTTVQPAAGPILAGVAARNFSLQSYQARVHIDVRMVSFPWLSAKVDGAAYYKRPNRHELVFDRVPSYAHGIKKLFGEIDDVAVWQRECNIAYSGTRIVDGRPLYVLDLSKKYSDQINDAVAYIDPKTYQVLRMDWHYRNGGTITMTQTYRQQGQYMLVSTQHADIHIPFGRAVASAAYSDYQTNVAVSDSVFTGK